MSLKNFFAALFPKPPVVEARNKKKEEEEERKRKEEEEREKELEDPLDKLREECKEKKAIADLFDKLEECNDRVNGKSNTTENCLEELFDYVGALDHCVAHDLFSKLK